MKAVVCNILGHRRSRRDARRIGTRWISYCRWCGKQMIRHGPQCWTATEYADGVANQSETAERCS